MRSVEEYRNAAEGCQVGEGVAYRAGKSDTPTISHPNLEISFATMSGVNVPGISRKTQQFHTTDTF
jgi:hypothetical protein